MPTEGDDFEDFEESLSDIKVVEPPDEDLPNLYKNCRTVYTAMLDDCYQEDGYKKWKGSLTKLFQANSVSIGNYTQTTQKLIQMGAVIQLQRGAAQVQSIWALLETPTFLSYQASYGSAGNRLKKKDKQKEQITALQTRVAKLELAVTKLQERDLNND